MAGFAYNFGSYSYSGRPSSHLNQRCLQAMLDEVLATGGINDVERKIVSDFPHYPSLNIAQSIANGTYLSDNGFDVCHKIPINSFQNALCECMNQELLNPGPVTAAIWRNCESLYVRVMSSLLASPSSDIAALYNAVRTNNQHQACSLAWVICLSFDSSHNNLYFGWAVTNRSIGQHPDMHYDVHSTAPGPCPPTPRGPHMEADLNTWELSLGLSTTDPWVEVDTTGDHWETTSSVFGRRSEDTGSIWTTR